MPVSACRAVTQAVLFTGGLPANRIGLAGAIAEALPDFKRMPLMIPIPDDAPPEVPRIMFESHTERYRCSVSLNQISLVITGNAQEVETSATEAIINLIKAVTGAGVQATRIGAVTTILADAAQDSLPFLRERFLGSRLRGDIAEFELAYRDCGEVDSRRVNRWTRFRSLPKALPAQNAMQFEMDIDYNTILQPGEVLSQDVLEGFVARVVRAEYLTLHENFGDEGGLQ